MSMNLNASCDDETIDLWQTPTQISYMICIDNNGNYVELKGEQAKRGLWSYIRWVEGNPIPLKSVFENPLKYRLEHIAYIKSCLDKKGLRVWVM